MKARAVTVEELGAWVLRCNPHKEGFGGMAELVDDGEVGQWTVPDNFRSHMMEAGDRVFFWVTGKDRRYPRGFWGQGIVVEAAESQDYYRDGPFKDQLFVKVDIPLHQPARPLLTHDQLLAAGIEGLEVQRPTPGVNPSWVSKAQLARIDERLEATGDGPVSPRISICTGFVMDEYKMVEMIEGAAMAAVTE